MTTWRFQMGVCMTSLVPQFHYWIYNPYPLSIPPRVRAGLWARFFEQAGGHLYMTRRMMK